MFIESGIDVNVFYDKGYYVFNLEECFANEMFDEVKRETMMRVIPHSDWERSFVNRYISKRSLHQPQNIPDIYRKYNDGLIKHLGPILSHYRGGDDPGNITTCAFAGTQGFYIDQHIDVGDRSIFDVILYLGHDIQDEADGGLVEFNRVVYNHEGKVESRALIDRIVPKHGMIIAFNNMNPTISHGVNELTKANAVRYTLISTMGAKNIPNWHLDYVDSPGAFLEESYVMSTDEDWLFEQSIKDNIKP